MTANEVAAFGPEHADVYEATYRARGKDWAREAAEVTDRIRARLPRASSLLDVACGTGAHLETFAARFDHVEGLEIAAAMRERAVRRLPGVPVHAGDMRDFDLGRSFDAITCLYTAIAYLGTLAEMREAVGTMARHLALRGVLVVEPWWTPDRFIDGYVGGDLVRVEDRVVARVSHTTGQGRTARMVVQWVVGEPSGVRRFTAVECFTMFTVKEYVAAFEAAGCQVEFEPEGLSGYGLFVATRR
ncbi:class I SAM-dependent methyltransferase [Nocardia transvalensis]|uniref:class I SAM-dependent methyltransferase n=1 Tax=Nocardia transvalensis TaxID=37333 RepID=UPI001894E82B|nr:class I SAM-dependent methyltransferase [Nocardia transvalensis]MBF6329808.1 class I SAM-dependent methyltransferase [Nocardia transvalensis]